MCRLRSFAILSGRLQEHRRALEFSSKPLSRPTQRLELSSVLAARSHRQQTAGYRYGRGQSDTPQFILINTDTSINLSYGAVQALGMGRDLFVFKTCDSSAKSFAVLFFGALNLIIRIGSELDSLTCLGSKT
jgi:hypothetical protein